MSATRDADHLTAARVLPPSRAIDRSLPAPAPPREEEEEEEDDEEEEEEGASMLRAGRKTNVQLELRWLAQLRVRAGWNASSPVKLQAVGLWSPG